MKFRPLSLAAVALVASAPAFAQTTTGHPTASATKGAVVGGVAGHMMGHHAVAGAAAGAMVGHHMRKKQMERSGSGG